MSEIEFERPFAEFKAWLDEAWKTEPNDAHAMTLATVDEAGRPVARIVLLKGVDERGFTFFTNYHSRKGRELAANPFAALVCCSSPASRPAFTCCGACAEGRDRELPV